MAACGVQTQAELGRFLDVSQPVVARAATTGKTPESWLYKVAYLTNTNVEWLRTGEGPQRREDTVVAESLSTYINQFTPKRDRDREAFLDRLLKYLASAEQDDVDSVRRLADALMAGSPEVRRHLIGQLELIERLDTLEKQTGQSAPPAKTKGTRRPRSA